MFNRITPSFLEAHFLESIKCLKGTPTIPELCERAVTTAVEHRAENPSQQASMTTTAGKLGMAPEALSSWDRQA
jgi:hypothetical protein